MVVGSVAELQYLSHMLEVVALICAELLDGEDLTTVIPCLPHIGTATGGERAFHLTNGH